jgi:TP901 family phage tail tape measure protein
MADYNLGTASGEIKVGYDGKGVEQAQADLGKLGKAGHNSADALNQAALVTAGAGAVIAGGLGLAAKTAIDFEKQISQIGAVSGASEAQLETLRKKALQLGVDTSFSASQAALAMEELVKAGLSVDDVMNGAADATVALAAAGGVDLPEAATIASNAMNQFNLNAKDLPKVADLIAGAANSSAIDVRDFGFSLSQVGAVAHLAGQSLEDTAVAIALMGNAGIKGSDAGTSLKTFLSNLIPTTDRAATAMEKLGIVTKNGSNQFLDAKGNFKGMSEIAGILHKSMTGLSEAEQQVALETIFGSDAIRAAAIIAKNGSTGFDKMATSMGSVTAEAVAAKRLDNTAGTIDALKGSAETAAIAIGTVLLPAIRQMAKWLTGLANWFNGLSKSTQSVVATILAVAAGILLFVGVVVKIVQMIKIFQAAWIALNISFTVTPIGAIIAAIVILIGIIVLIATKTDWFQRIWANVWSWMKGVGAWFAGPFANFFKQAWDKILEGLNAISAPFKAIWNAILAVVDFVWTAISAVVAVQMAIMRGIILPILKFIWGIVSTYLGFVQKVFTEVWNFIVGVVTTAWNFIRDIIVGAFNFLQPYIQAALGIIKHVWETVWGVISAAAKTVWDVISAIVSNGVKFIVRIIDGIKEMVRKVKGFFEDLKAAADGGIGKLIAFVKGIPGKILSAIGNLGKLLLNAGKDLITGLINGITDAVPGLRSTLNWVTDLVPEWKGPEEKDKKLLEPTGGWIMAGLVAGLVAAVPLLTSTLSDITGMISKPAVVGGYRAPNGNTGVVGPRATATDTAPGKYAGAVIIENIILKGVWDFADAGAARKIIAAIYDALERYKKDYA